MRPHLPPISEWTYSTVAPFQGRYAISLSRAGIHAPRPYAGVALEFVGSLGGRDALWDVFVYGTHPTDPAEATRAVPRAIVEHGPAGSWREAVERAERQLALDLAPASLARRPTKAASAPRKPAPARRAPPARASAKAPPKRPTAPARGRAPASKANPFAPLGQPLAVGCGKAPRRR